jgi:hypothetical protein
VAQHYATLSRRLSGYVLCGIAPFLASVAWLQWCPLVVPSGGGGMVVYEQAASVAAAALGGSLLVMSDITMQWCHLVVTITTPSSL